VDPECTTLETGRPQYESSAACVIAQQYSSITFLPLSFHYGKEKFIAPFRNVITIFLFFNTPNSKITYFGTA
jgi:hypothetical protein